MTPLRSLILAGGCRKHGLSPCVRCDPLLPPAPAFARRIRWAIIFAYIVFPLIVLLCAAIADAQTTIQSWRWTDPDTTLRIAGWPAVKPGAFKVQNSVRTLSYEHPAGHEATIKVRTLKTVQTFTITVKASDKSSLEYIFVTLPGATGKATTVLSAFGGGTEWPYPEWWLQGNSAGYPDNYGFSPLAMFYDSKGAGIQLTAWNDELKSLNVHWWTGPGVVVPELGMWCRLEPGQSTVYTFELRYFAKGLPKAGAEYYRESFLKPWLDKRGIDECKWKAGGVWGFTAYPWLVDQQRVDLVETVRRFKAAGATSFAMWSPASSVYEPDQRKLQWSKDYAEAAKLVEKFGCLINPYFHDIHEREANLNSPRYRAWLEKLADDLQRAGVTYAFWDTGAQRDGLATGWQRVEVMRLFLARGIHVSPEAGGDISMAVTGTATQWTPGNTRAPLLPQWVTPNGTYFVMDNAEDWWRQRVEKVGAVPMLTEGQLQN
jgi:hypothetical protein